MDVYKSTRQHAAFKIFKEVIRDQPVVTADEFRHLWGQTGLRSADCQKAIDDLVNQGYMRSTLKSSRRIFTLTEDGLDEIAHSQLSLSRRLKDWFTLKNAQGRRAGHGGAGHRGRRPEADGTTDDQAGGDRH